MDLRCQYKKHGELEDGFIEVKCSSQLCGAKAGTVVLHRFDVSTGTLVQTLRFKDPTRKEKAHGANHNPAAVRSA